MSGNSQKGFFTREIVAEQLKVKLNAAVYQANELEGKKDGFIGDEVRDMACLLAFSLTFLAKRNTVSCHHLN